MRLQVNSPLGPFRFGLCFKRDLGGCSSEAMDELMALTGLKRVKEWAKAWATTFSWKPPVKEKRVGWAKAAMACREIPRQFSWKRHW